MKHYDVAIIGAGTAGLTARAEVAKHTDNYVLIDDGILGTTCARVGCMPSKALIEIANTFHKRRLFDVYGIDGAADLSPDLRTVMARVRHLRDRFAGGVVRGMGAWDDHFIAKRARFLDSNTLDLGDTTIRARRIIIAVGSKPTIPEPWQPYADYILDTDRFFELEELPRQIAVFGLGPIGIELGQAMARLGIRVTGVTRSNRVGGLSDPVLQELAMEIFSKELDIIKGSADILGDSNGMLRVGCRDKAGDMDEESIRDIDRVLLATGRKPPLTDMGLENLGVDLGTTGMPAFDPGTLQIGDLPVFIAGDANRMRPILHEAADQGRIAGINAMAESSTCFARRMPLKITFSSPNIAVVGRSYKEMAREGQDMIIGETDFSRQGRAMIMGQNKGKVRIYGDKEKGALLGAEMIAPSGEHLAHLIAWTAGAGMTADQILSMPFYHPVLEEGLRTAFRTIAKNTRVPKSVFEFRQCGDVN